ELSPQMIADYFYVSLRQLHSKFSEEDQTISSYIRNERIRRIRQALADPTYQDETVQSISSRFGLTDASHVSKLFKQTYGQTPSGYLLTIFGQYPVALLVSEFFNKFPSRCHTGFQGAVDTDTAPAASPFFSGKKHSGSGVFKVIPA